MEQVLDFLDGIGAAVCHRLPERSFFWDGRQMPLCARCTGLYTGAFFASCFFFWRRRQKGDVPFSMPAIVLTACALLPIAADGFCSYIGLWESSQLLRVLTGAAAGAAMPALFLLAGNFDPVKKPTRPIYGNTWELPALLAASLLWGLALWLGLPVFAAGAAISAAGVACFWTGAGYILLRGLFPRKSLPFWRLAAGLAAAFLWALRSMQ